ncbi:hypothetical protein Pcinc_024314 [Petrolisthes cinctipes]|uniref:Uncharacterized protein n=1 Tax=Petrolisthes cinctipes TaxID=88211 RepID=A0AAE1KFH8_PETCI|nr:hypothetical protein Pcinc_024314 [Petrolisthes cinctipes]
MKVNVSTNKEVEVDGKQARGQVKAATVDVGRTHAEGRLDSLAYNHTGKRSARVEDTRTAGPQLRTHTARIISGTYNVNGTISRTPARRPTPIGRYPERNI